MSVVAWSVQVARNWNDHGVGSGQQDKDYCFHTKETQHEDDGDVRGHSVEDRTFLGDVAFVVHDANCTDWDHHWDRWVHLKVLLLQVEEQMQAFCMKQGLQGQMEIYHYCCYLEVDHYDHNFGSVVGNSDQARQNVENDADMGGNCCCQVQNDVSKEVHNSTSKDLCLFLCPYYHCSLADHTLDLRGSEMTVNKNQRKVEY